jgi:hypothetical protein
MFKKKKRKSKINLREKNIKIKTLDVYWAKCIKARDKKCVYCGNTNMSELEAHHIRARKHSEVKFDLDDGVTLCKPYKGCSGHYKAHHSYEMKEWIKDYIGRKKYEELDRRSYQVKKWSSLEKRDLLRNFKEYLKENE